MLQTQDWARWWQGCGPVCAASTACRWLAHNRSGGSPRSGMILCAVGVGRTPALSCSRSCARSHSPGRSMYPRATGEWSAAVFRNPSRHSGVPAASARQKSRGIPGFGQGRPTRCCVAREVASRLIRCSSTRRRRTSRWRGSGILAPATTAWRTEPECRHSVRVRACRHSSPT